MTPSATSAAEGLPPVRGHGVEAKHATCNWVQAMEGQNRHVAISHCQWDGIDDLPRRRLRQARLTVQPRCRGILAARTGTAPRSRDDTLVRHATAGIRHYANGKPTCGSTATRCPFLYATMSTRSRSAWALREVRAIDDEN